MRFRLFPILCFILWSMSSVRAQMASSPDSAASTTGETLFLTDSLTIRYAGQGATEASLPSESALKGSFEFVRTFTPLNHAGDNIYLPFLQDALLRDIIRQTKAFPQWHPFRPGPSTTYHYDGNGATKNSQTASLYLERSLRPESGYAYRLLGRYREQWGPFPSQQTTRLEALISLSTRLNTHHIITLQLLGADDGWYLRRGNRVYTDRARYILEEINAWRAKTGGVELSGEGKATSAVSYSAYLRIAASQWASDPADPALPGAAAHPPFISGVLPATMRALFSAERTFHTAAMGGQVTFNWRRMHDITAGIEMALHRFRRHQLWRPLQTRFEYDLSVTPREYAGYVQDRLRFGELVMLIGIRYDMYRPGGALWRDLYQTLGDERIVEASVRQLLISAGGDSKGAGVASPSFSVSYPHRRFTVHLAYDVAYRFPTLEDLYNRSETAPSVFADGSATSIHPRRMTTLEGGIGAGRKGYNIDVTAFYRDAERFIPVFGPDVLPQTLSNYAGHWGRVDAGLQRQHGFAISVVRPSASFLRTRLRLLGRLSYMRLGRIGPVPPADGPQQPGTDLEPGDFTTFDSHINLFWNRRHWISATAALHLPSGLILTSAVHTRSSAPYRRTVPVDGAGGTGLQSVVRYGPWNATVDGRLDLPIHLRPSSKPTVNLFVEVRNLLNKASIQALPDPRYFETTGQPDNPALDQRQRAYGPVRAVWAGIGVGW